jgi:CRISPR type I-E-associated protein CasB/Cse2
MSRANQLLSSIAYEIASGRFGTGDLAALRRMDPAAPGRAATVAYRLLVDAVGDRDELERWLLVVHALALLRGGHDPKIAIGVALSAIEFSEARLQQLLSADWSVLRDLVPRIARRLAAQRARLDFAPLMRLILTVDRFPDEADSARLGIAKSFVRAQHAANLKRTSP